MRAVVQRVTRASVTIAARTVAEIGAGVVVLVGIAPEDDGASARWLADKVVNLRIFPDEDGRMNRSLDDARGSALVISQFTLYGDARKGRRPSFIHAAQGPEAEVVYDETLAAFREAGITTAAGEFGAYMEVELVNDGPVTILLDSEKLF